MIITGSIDVTKIDKSRLYTGKKGTYLNIKIMLNDEADQYGNHGFIAEQVSKEEYQAGTKGEILGNVRKLETGQPDRHPDKQEVQDDLPF